MIVGLDATTLSGRMSGVGYYTARLMESLANGSSDAISRLVVLSNKPVTVPPADRLFVHTGNHFGIRSVWMQLVLPRVLRRVKPDVVHFTNYLAPLLTGVPYVVSFHDMSLSLFPQYHTLKKRLLTSSLIPAVARRARRILVPSESTRRDVVRLLGVDPARVIHIPYAASERFRPVAEGPARLARAYGIRPPYFLYVGTLEPRKNLVRTLRAFARIAPSFPGHQFVLVGDLGWQYGGVLGEARRADLQGRVVIPGYVPEEDLPLLYTHATALVYVSLYEGFGFPVVEAMACGTPVLTSRTSSLAEIGDGAALLVDPSDERAIAEGLGRLAGEAGLRQDVRRRGLARAASFSWENTGRETAEVYREVVEETRHLPSRRRASLRCEASRL